MKILMETAFLQLYEIPAAVDLLGRNVRAQQVQTSTQDEPASEETSPHLFSTASIAY
ncbi:hypothetical protein T4A_5552 [Trichinella pseudospiralis]|uniref:Uncharacterized protein n=1 Tax=Trichinella pseudospiralis TaxID=6337 RepID=A0A0V1DL35_TRIPS|nr:hypothetical protein T4A_5552 [Trichinella pseudospiralis]